MNMPTISPVSFEEALEGVRARAQTHDISNNWPAEDLMQLYNAGAMKWAVPMEFGGEPLSPFELHLRYEKLATASVATALILTQRDAAVGLIEAAVDCESRAALLTQLAKNAIWATVGIAQLTTSRQGGKPALIGHKVEGGYLLDGTIPWCTGAGQSTFIVAGAEVDGAGQILLLLQPHQERITVDPPLPMVALNNTLTGSIRLREVFIEDSRVLRGPVQHVLSGRRNSLTLGQTFTATGLTHAALALIAEHNSEPARKARDRFAAQLDEVRREIAWLCQPGREIEASAANARLRGACNNLALRVAHAAIALYKGAALLRDHPAQRLAREAMFLLVWSCPNPVIDCTVDLLMMDPRAD
jgi:butyryl-CoA dehydrogenase